MPSEGLRVLLTSIAFGLTCDVSKSAVFSNDLFGWSAQQAALYNPRRSREHLVELGDNKPGLKRAIVPEVVSLNVEEFSGSKGLNDIQKSSKNKRKHQHAYHKSNLRKHSARGTNSKGSGVPDYAKQCRLQ
ncbi:unnamed protein product [Notodromas monacha]|uniref:Uncharacterized protein n=1 Tax=Notodromas monacha TaxID=399045 RepID=A0A7R9BGR5_9CRUS|nr:unnamed protein product [Notodromas monacha]CAG0915178.1 unnamed protein product [Notodromas monacha]